MLLLYMNREMQVFSLDIHAYSLKIMYVFKRNSDKST